MITALCGDNVSVVAGRRRTILEVETGEPVLGHSIAIPLKIAVYDKVKSSTSPGLYEGESE